MRKHHKKMLSIIIRNILFKNKKVNIVIRKIKLNVKIPHFYNGEIALYYYSATWLYAREFVGKEFAGCYPQVTCLYREGQPNQQTTMISARKVNFRWISCNSYNRIIILRTIINSNYKYIEGEKNDKICKITKWK